MTPTTRFHRFRSLTGAMLVGALCGLPAAAMAQPAAPDAGPGAAPGAAPDAASDPDRARAYALFDRADQAFREMQPLSASFRQWADVSEQLANAMGGELNGTMLIALSEEPDEGVTLPRDAVMGSQWAVRVTGLGRLSPRDTAPTDFDFALFPARSVWVDTDSEQVIERTPSAAFRGWSASTAVQMVDLPELRARDAFEVAKGGISYEFEEQQQIDGILCDVVVVTHAQNTVGQAGRRSPSRPFTSRQSRYFFGTDDGLLRRVDRISDFGGGLRVSLNVEFPDIGPDDSLTMDDFEIPTPDGYTRDVSASVRSTRRVGGTPDTDRAPVAAPDTAPRETVRLPAAPEFSIPDGRGGTVSLDAIKGSPSVLYWWGTWCIPCREVSPLVSTLADDYAEHDVRVIGMATRESDPQAPVEYIDDNAYEFELGLVDDETARNFRVRMYPSIYVLNAEGEIALVASPAAMRGVPRDRVPGALLEQVRNTLDELINEG